METAKYVLTITCEDQAGIVSEVTSSLATIDAFIVELDQHSDYELGRFFMRIAFNTDHRRERILDSLDSAKRTFDFDVNLYDCQAKTKVFILVSKHSHCLNDLLYRQAQNLLDIEIVGVASNHKTTEAMVSWYGIPYHYLPVEKESKAQQEKEVIDLIHKSGAELVILARYMQILSEEFCEAFPCKIINIHHSFLPAFIGAKPYHQAHQRGVKLIGATAHFVTCDLDEGPIIEQDVKHVKHSHTAKQLVHIGRDIETQVLARAVEWYAARRILINSCKTVVF